MAPSKNKGQKRYRTDTENVEDEENVKKLRDPVEKTSGVLAAQKTGEGDPFEDFEDEIEEEEEASSESGNEDAENDDGGDKTSKPKRQAWLPSNKIGEGEGLECDPRTYHMMHHFELGWSCLSLDILRDDFGMERHTYPYSMTIVAGSQADQTLHNRIYIVELSKIYKTNKDADEDEFSSSSSSSDDDDDDANEEENEVMDRKMNISGTDCVNDNENDYSSQPPTFKYATLAHDGVVNRIRSCPMRPQIVATWSDRGKVFVWDISAQLENLNSGKLSSDKDKYSPQYTSTAHRKEGFALDWDTCNVGRFLSGGNDNKIFMHQYGSGHWQTGVPFVGHSGSVEDVKWRINTSGTSDDVFASCSSDQTIKLWDARKGPTPVHNMTNGHVGDINVCAWSPTNADLLLSGGDDGVVCCWDTRAPESPVAQVARIKFHSHPISSVDWHPTDSTQFASSSLDDSIAIWDLSVEADDANTTPTTTPGVPDQLMFLHLGQHHISEFKWHPQIPGVIVSTAEDGFNVFKAENM